MIKGLMCASADGGGSIDSYFSNVSLLLKGDGDFNDYSSRKNTVTVTGSTQISTTTKKYGTGSIWFPGSSQIYLTGNYQLTGDFTVEFWIYLISCSGGCSILAIGAEGYGESVRRKLFGISAPTWTTNDYQLFIDNYGGPQYYLGGASTVIANMNKWAHYAFVRSGSTITAYINGVATGTTATISGTFGSPTNLYMASVSNAYMSINAYFDEVRVTNGVARYTTNFTPPITGFPTN